MADDKPGHILEISDALGRDVDRAREGKAPAPPIEAFLSDTTLREIERASRAKDELVPAESLRPITRGQASARTTFDGHTLPAAPQMRRVRPAPFRRPRIEAGSHGKSWQWVTVEDVGLDDIVPDVGKVTDITEHVVHKTRGEVLGDIYGWSTRDSEGQELDRMTPAPLIDKTIEFPDLGDLTELVAVGTVVLLTGMGGSVKAFRPGSPVQVFRKSV